MNAFFLREQFIAGLVEVTGLAVVYDQLDDAESLIQAVRVLTPDLPQLDSFEALVAVGQERWQRAIHILSGLDSKHPDWVVSQALLAYCEHEIDDPAWSTHANEVLENHPGSRAARFVTLFTNDAEHEDAPGEAEPADGQNGNGSSPGHATYEPRSDAGVIMLRA